jgi:hypothetical protein
LLLLDDKNIMKKNSTSKATWRLEERLVLSLEFVMLLRVGEVVFIQDSRLEDDE